MNKKLICIFTVLLILILTIFKSKEIDNLILKKFYPIKYEEYVYEYSKENNIDPLLIFAIIKTESNFKENVKSKSGAIGLMQLMPETGREQAKNLEINYTDEVLYDPKENIKIGIYYYNYLLDYYNENYILAFAAYNAGIGNVDKWIETGTINNLGTNVENIPFKETNMYVRKIICNYEMYKKLYEGD